MDGCISNVRISNTFLGIEDHGIFAWNIDTIAGPVGQGTGAYSVRHNVETLEKIIRVLEVTEWGKLVGTNCRVRRDKPYGRIIAIGHIIEENWVELP